MCNVLYYKEDTKRRVKLLFTIYKQISENVQINGHVFVLHLRKSSFNSIRRRIQKLCTKSYIKLCCKNKNVCNSFPIFGVLSFRIFTIFIA